MWAMTGCPCVEEDFAGQAEHVLARAGNGNRRIYLGHQESQRKFTLVGVPHNLVFSFLFGSTFWQDVANGTC